MHMYVYLSAHVSIEYHNTTTYSTSLYNIIIYVYNFIGQVKNEGDTGTAVLFADMLYLLSLFK